VQAHIGGQFRSACEQILAEPIPKRLAALIETLARKDKV